MEYIDLSYNIEEEMPVYPGDINLSLIEDKDYKDDGYTSYIIKTGLHIGTHIDAPMHLTENNKFIKDYAIENFIGDATILDARYEKVIDFKEEYIEKIKGKKIVIIYTGFQDKYGLKEYYEEHHIITEGLVQLFIDNNIKMVGFDMPSPDRFPFNIHKKLLSNEIFILENLCNLDKIDIGDNFKLIALPLKIKSESSLVRAIAIIDNKDAIDLV